MLVTSRRRGAIFKHAMTCDTVSGIGTQVAQSLISILTESSSSALFTAKAPSHHLILSSPCRSEGAELNGGHVAAGRRQNNTVDLEEFYVAEQTFDDCKC